MKNLIIIGMVLYLAIPQSIAQFHANYDTYFRDYAHSMDYSEDGGYLVTGKHIGTGTQGQFASISKITDTGTMAWTNFYNDVHLFNSIRYLDNGLDFMAAGQKGGKGLLAGFDKNGGTMYSYQYFLDPYPETITFNQIQSMEKFGKKEMVVLGTVSQNGVDSRNILVSLMDYNGNEIVSTEIFSEVYVQGTWIEPLRDGGYAITGEIKYSCRRSDQDISILVIKLDKNLNLVWSKIINGKKQFEKVNQTFAHCIKEDWNGDLIITGYSNQFVTTIYHDLQFLAKLDGNGNPYRIVSYGPYPVSFGKSSLVVFEEKEEYMVSTSVYSADAVSGWDAMLLGIDETGVLNSVNTYGSALHFIQAGTDLHQSKNGDFSFLGQSIINSDYELHLFKTDYQGKMNGCENVPNLEVNKHEYDFCDFRFDYKKVTLNRTQTTITPYPTAMNESGCGLSQARQDNSDLEQLNDSEEKPEGSLEVYPNPVNNLLNVYIPEGASTVSIMNMEGKVIYQQAVETFEGKLEVPVQHLKPGMYLLNLDGNGINKQVVRFIKK